jgi:hypothetical protein
VLKRVHELVLNKINVAQWSYTFHEHMTTGSKFLTLWDKIGMFQTEQFLHEFCTPQNSELLWQSQNNTKYNSMIKLLEAPQLLSLLQVMMQQVNFKSGTSNGGKHTTSCINDVLIADHKTNKRYRRLRVASKETRFIPHTSKSALQLPSSNTQQNRVTIYLVCVPFMHIVQITNKYHIIEWVLYGSGPPHTHTHTHTHTLELVYNTDSLRNKFTTTFSCGQTRWYMETLEV